MAVDVTALEYPRHLHGPAGESRVVCSAAEAADVLKDPAWSVVYVSEDEKRERVAVVEQPKTDKPKTDKHK